MTGHVTRLTRFRQFPSTERRVLVTLAFMLALARVGIRCAGIARTRRLAGWVSPQWSLEPQRLADLVRVAAQVVPGLTLCVPRSIVLEATLIAAGHAAEMRIGVAPRGLQHQDEAAGPGRLTAEAHAWVEIAGVPLAEDTSRYTPLPVFGTRG